MRGWAPACGSGAWDRGAIDGRLGVRGETARSVQRQQQGHPVLPYRATSSHPPLLTVWSRSANPPPLQLSLPLSSSTLCASPYRRRPIARSFLRPAAPSLPPLVASFPLARPPMRPASSAAGPSSTRRLPSAVLLSSLLLLCASSPIGPSLSCDQLIARSLQGSRLLIEEKPEGRAPRQPSGAEL